MSDLLKLGGLWKQKDKKGNDYFSGDFTFGTKILIYKNSYKEKENDPDYVAYLSPKQKKGEGKQHSSSSDLPF